MTVQNREHDVHESDIAVVEEVVACDYMPATMAVVTLSAFADIDGELDFKTDALPQVARRIDEVRVSLVMIVFIGRTTVHAITENVAYQTGEIVSLNQVLERHLRLDNHVSVHSVNDGLGQIRSVPNVAHSQTFWKRHLRSKIPLVENGGRFA